MYKKASLDGWLKWEVIESGKVVSGGEQHNLFLDKGLDLLAEHGPANIAYYCCVGTGNSQPDVSNTILDSEISRITASRPWAEVEKRGDGVYDAVWIREFEEGKGTGNLTEWGFSPTKDGDLSVRELFRDSNGNPIVISKLDNQRLRLTYTLRVVLSPTILTPVSFELAGVGNINAEHCLTYSPNSSVKDKDWQTFIAVICPKATPYAYGLTLEGAQNFTGYGLDSSSRYRLPGIPTCERAPYVPGSFSRRVSVTFSPSQAIGDFYGVVVSGDTYNNRNIGVGWAIRFGMGFTKPDTHKVDFDLLGFTWGRA